MKKFLSALKSAFTFPEVLVDDAHGFWLKNGESEVIKICHSVKELKQALKAYPEALEFHESEHFAGWVEKIFNNKTLARKIRIAPLRKIPGIL